MANGSEKMETMIEMMMMMTLMLWGVWTVKRYTDMSIIEKMRRDFDNITVDLLGPVGAGKYQQLVFQADHWSIDRFNDMLGGNYGEDHYKRYLRQVAQAATTLSYVRFRSIAINAFTTMLSLEYGCSYGYAQRCLVDVMGDARNLAHLNQELIQNVVSHYNETIGEEAHYLIWFDFREKKIVEWDDGGVG